MNDPKPSAQQQALARQRAQLIMQVQNGLVSAQEAARQLGISRKTYYEWEKRGLAGMLEALEDREPGRPLQPVNPEMDAMEQKIRELERQLAVAEQTVEVRRMLDIYRQQQKPQPGGTGKKNKRPKKR